MISTGFRLSALDIRELKKVQIRSEGGRVIFDRLLCERLVTAGLLVRTPEVSGATSAATGRNYVLTQAGQLALDSGAALLNDPSQ